MADVNQPAPSEVVEFSQLKTEPYLYIVFLLRGVSKVTIEEMLLGLPC